MKPITIILSTGMLGASLLGLSYLKKDRDDWQKLATIGKPTDEPLNTFILKLMTDRASSMPAYKRDAIAAAIERVAVSQFAKRESQEAFAVLIAIESGFNERAKSTAGASGLTQVMPQYASAFMKYCGVDKFDVADLQQIEFQLQAGACAFKQLLEMTGGNTTAALVAFNAGTSSVAFKALMRGANIANVESANYATKHSYLLEKVKLNAVANTR